MFPIIVFYCTVFECMQSIDCYVFPYPMCYDMQGAIILAPPRPTSVGATLNRLSCRACANSAEPCAATGRKAELHGGRDLQIHTPHFMHFTLHFAFFIFWLSHIKMHQGLASCPARSMRESFCMPGFSCREDLC